LQANFDDWHPVARRHPLRLLDLLVMGLSASLALGSTPVFAAPPAESPAEEPIDTEARAMTAFNDGQAAYDRGEYKVALELFLEAQSLYPSPVFHYNIARCYEALENYEQAITSYNAYLRSTKSSTGQDPEDKQNIENTIARLEKLLEAERAEDEAARNKEPIVIVKESDQPKGPPPGRAALISGGVLTAIGAGVLIGGGAVFGSRAASVSRQLEGVYSGNPDHVTLEEARDLDAQGRSAERNQIIMMSIGSALAVTGIALLVVGGIKAKKGKAAKPSDAAPAPEKPAARLIPALGPGNAGFVLQGRF
jgi:tetratricopeptide (TPR) repeat protein